MRFGCTGEVYHWRGPAPWYFLDVPDDLSAEIKDRSAELTFGWGMIAAILVLSVILSVMPWRGATHLDGPPALDDDPSDATYPGGLNSSGDQSAATAASSNTASSTNTSKEG